MGKTEVMCDCDIIHNDNVKSARAKMLDDDRLLLIADFYKALSDSTRIRIIDALKDTALCVCDLAVILNMTKSAVSHQLRYLREMDIVKYVKVGKEVIYSLNDDHVKQIFEISCKHLGECHNESKN